LTAYRPTDSLMTSLARAGWGDLTGRHLQGVRSTLRALVDLLPHGSGQGEATASQIADASGLSERWTRRCLGILEDAGLISWHRGGVAYGRPQPSAFRIAKRALVDLIRGARPVLAVIQARRAEATAARLRGLTFVKSRGRHKPRSVHAALSASPHPQGGVSPAPKGGDETTATMNDDDRARIYAEGAALAKQLLREARQREN